MKIFPKEQMLHVAVVAACLTFFGLTSLSSPVIAAQDPAKVEAMKKKKEAEAAAAAERAEADRKKREAAEKAAEDEQSAATKALLERKRKEMSAAEEADRAAGGGTEKADADKAAVKEKAKIVITDEKRAEAAKAASSLSLADALKVEKGQLFNPYTDNEEAIKEGKQLYLNYSCNGCHGGGGGGGMCPPLTNERFVYGSNDDVIFRLIAAGSKKLQDAGYKRIARETVVGPMPPYEELIENAEELWKIIAYVRSVYRGREKKRDW